MKTAIRFAICVLMAGTSTAAFAGSYEESAAEQQGYTETNAHAPGQLDTDMNAKVNERAQDDAAQDLGHGSGEPGAPDASAGTSGRADAERAAVDEQNRQRFLNEVWNSP